MNIFSGFVIFVQCWFIWPERVPLSLFFLGADVLDHVTVDALVVGPGRRRGTRIAAEKEVEEMTRRTTQVRAEVLREMVQSTSKCVSTLCS